jgi:FKBP-type peptidyl-prolyl cis-trans isomerase FklB
MKTAIYVFRPRGNHMRVVWFIGVIMTLFHGSFFSQGTSLPIFNGIDEAISLIVYNSPVNCKKNFAVQLNLKRGLRNSDELVQWKMDYTGCDGKRYTADLSTPIGIRATNASDILSFASSYSNELNLEHAFIFPSSELANVKSIFGVRDVSVISEHGKSGLLLNQNDSLSYSVGVSIGSRFAEMQLVGLNYDLVTKGLIDQSVKDVFIDRHEAEEYIQRVFASRVNIDTDLLKKEGEDFLARNKNEKGVITTATGLQYKINYSGKGLKPKSTDTVKIHYHGTTIDGRVFDSSIDLGTPAVFALDQVIEGFSEGIQLMNVGSKFRLFIPEYLAYGSQSPNPAVKPYSVLVFEVELLDIE